MSFFDEVDEPPPRTPPRRRRPSGSGRRPPGDRQSIQARRGVAAVVLLILVILIALGVHSCQVSARNSALRTYTNDVSSLIQRSNATGKQLFDDLASTSASNVTSVNNQVNQTRADAVTELNDAHSLSVPGEVTSANAKLLLAMQMRVDGITNIASQIQPALGTTASKPAIYAIAASIEALYSSDVVYKDYVTKEIAAALHAAGIGVGGTNGETIAPGQFVSDVYWVTPTFVAQELHVSLPASGSGGKFTPGLHGHALNSVSVAGTTLQTGSPNTIPASPVPTFTLNFTNGGNFNEFNVVCKVTVSGTSDSGQKVVSETFAHQPVSCKVPLDSVPATGTATVVATIEKVPGEKDLNNNSLSFPVTFQ